MNLLLVGISHRTAPVDLRERVDFQVRGVADALRAVAGRGSTREAVVVSTCNRAELYVACDDAAATRVDLVAFLSEFHGVQAADLTPHLYDVHGLDAARRIGWGGRRAAYLSAVGFAIVLLNFVPISYFLTKSHNF